MTITRFANNTTGGLTVIEHNFARNYEELWKVTAYYEQVGGQKGQGPMGFPSYCEPKKNLTFREAVTVLSNWFLKIHFFPVMQGITKSYGRFLGILDLVESNAI